MPRPEAAALSTGPRPAGTGVVVSPHHLASRAGIDVLRAGGNAVDAAIAVDAVLAVVLPDTCGPGGDLFALLHAPGMMMPVALNASGRAGSGVSADDLRDRGLGEIPHRSPWSVTVPGCVDGWEALTDAHGSMPLATTLAPAIALARDGFEVSDELAWSLERLQPLIGSQPSAPPLYPDDEPAPPGTVIVRPDLAATLEEVADGGREAFYGGRVGTDIVAAAGGAITPEDLAATQADWIEPCGLDVLGRTGWTIPPNSQGYLTLATLWLFEQLDPPDDPTDPLYHHLLIESYRSVAWERDDTVADPRTAPMAASELLDPSRLRTRLDRISRTATTRWPMPTPRPAGTAYMAVLDGDGMGISLIQSNFTGIGSGISAGDSGVWLHNRGAGFNLIPGHPNEYEPGKRPLHTLSPTLWTRDGDLALLLGTRGGHQQPQFLAQMAAHHLHAGMPGGDAQSVPRWSMRQPAPGTDSAVEVEGTMATPTAAGLVRLGHGVDAVGPFRAGWGPVSMIDVVGGRVGSADPRVSTTAALAT